MVPFLLPLFFPPLSDLQRFPTSWDCECQQENCREHVKRLRAWEASRGHEDGRWDRARKETEERLRYWELLHGAHNAPGEFWQRQRLRELFEELGPFRYKKGWSPPLIPGRSCFNDPWDRIMLKVGPND